MFRIVMLTCLVLLAGILAGYGTARTPDRPPLTFVNNAQINTLDPQQMSWTSDIRMALNLWEGLTTHDPDTLEPRPGMAELPPKISDGGTRYVFRLRPDGRWSNGDPVTAHDFVRGWRRALEPGTAADYAFLLADHIAGAREYYEWRNSGVRALGRLAPRDPGEAAAYLRQHAADMDIRWERVGITALDAQTLEVRLVRPTPYFLELTLLSVMLPIHHSIELLRRTTGGLAVDGHGLVVFDSQWTKPDYRRGGYPGLVTNGPYCLRSWQFRRRLRLARNPHHYDFARLRLDTVDLMMFENANTAFQAYETGVVDWLTDLSVNYAGALLAKGQSGERPDIHIAPAFGIYFYNLNCGDPSLPDGRTNPFVDRRVRQAFALSLDRHRLCAAVAEKANPPVDTLIPPGSIPGYRRVAGQPYDPALANQLLDRAGYTDRASFPRVSILYNTGFIHERVAEAVGHMWREALGVRVGLEGRETRIFADDKAKHNFQIARASWYGDYGDPTTFLDIFATGNGNNDSGYSDPEYDALLQRAARCTDPAARLELLAEAETRLVHHGFPFIPIYQYTNPQAFRAWVKGIRPNPREIYPLRHLWVEQ